MIRLGINGKSFVTENPGGAVRVAIATVAKLKKANPDLEIIVYIPTASERIVRYFDPLDIKVVAPSFLGFFSPIGKALWEQFLFPFYSVKDGCDYLLNLVNSCPFFQGKIRGIHLIHDLGFLNTTWFTPLFSRYLYFCLRFGVNNHKVTMTKVLAARISDLVEGKSVSVIPHGFSREPKPISTDSTDKYVLFLGSLNPRKNLSGLLIAFSKFKSLEPHNELHLRIIGVAKEIFVQEELNLEENVTYHGYVSDKEKYDLLASAQALILPSFEEGFGIPILEALDFNIPVMASKLDVFYELFGTSLCYFDPLDTESMIQCFRNNFDSCGNYVGAFGSDQSATTLSKFDWSTNSKRYIEIINTETEWSWKAL